MPDLPLTQVPRVEIRARLTRDLYDKLQEECAHCGCALNSVVSLAIAREIQLRSRRRQELRKYQQVTGQLKIDSVDNA